MAKAKCNCNRGMNFLAILLMVVGIYFLVWGFLSQTSSSLSWSSIDWNAMLYYLIGLVIFGFGKMTKCNSCADCKVHTKH